MIANSKMSFPFFLKHHETGFQEFVIAMYMYVCRRERFGTRNLGMHKSHFLAKFRSFYSCLKTMSCLSINQSSSLSASFIYPYCYSLKSGLGNGRTSSGKTGSRRRHKQRCEASKQVKDTGLFTSFFVSKWLWTGVMEHQQSGSW